MPELTSLLLKLSSLKYAHYPELSDTPMKPILGDRGKEVDRIQSISGVMIPASPLVVEFYKFAWGWRTGGDYTRWFSPDEFYSVLIDEKYRDVIDNDIELGGIVPDEIVDLNRVSILGIDEDAFANSSYWVWRGDNSEPAIAHHASEVVLYENIIEYIIACIDFRTID